MTIEQKQRLLPKWYVDRFLKPKPAENPADQNVDIIRNGFNRLVQTITAPPNAWFSHETALTLVTKNSKRIDATLQYLLRKGNPEDNSYLVAQLAIHQKKQLAQRSWYINVLDEARIGYFVGIDSYSDTAQQWEGNRLGSSLLLLSNDVIKHIVRHNTHFGPIPVYATIDDSAMGHFPTFRFRQGWTSHFAKQLGYRETAKRQFEKWY